MESFRSPTPRGWGQAVPLARLESVGAAAGNVAEEEGPRSVDQQGAAASFAHECFDLLPQQRLEGLDNLQTNIGVTAYRDFCVVPV